MSANFLDVQLSDVVSADFCPFTLEPGAQGLKDVPLELAGVGRDNR